MSERRTVMVVDDDPAVLDYYRKIFSPSGGDLDILGSAAPREEEPVDLRLFEKPSALLEAFSAERALGRQVPICILDMRMPELSGLDAAQRLRAMDPGLSIIISTAYSDASADTLKEKLQAGIFLVRKPFVAEEFRLLVHSILREWEGRLALRRSEERLRQIIDGTRAGTWEWNVKTGEAVFNERWAEIAGYTLAELAPVSMETWTKLAHPGDLKESRALLERHFSGELDAYDFECRMRHKDGRWVWVHDRGRVVERDAAGAPIRMSGTHSDITARKEAERDIKRQSALINSLLDSVPDIIFFKDRDGVYLGCNPPFTRFVGRPKDAIVGRTDNDLFDKKTAGFFREQDRLMLERREPRHNDEWVTYPDGARVLLDTLKTPYWGPDCELIGVLGISRDITDARRAQEALAASEEKLRLVLDSAAEAIYGIDTDGNCTFCNRSCLRLLGYSAPAQLLGRNMHGLIHYKRPDGSDFPVDDCRIFRAFKKGEGAHVDDEVLWRADGTSFQAEYWSYPQHRDGRITGAVVTFIDITERRRAERLLEQVRRNYQTFFNSIHDFLFVLDEKGNIIHINDTVTQRLGYAPHELLGMPVLNVHPPERREEAGRIVAEMLQGKAESCPVPLITKRGERIPVETRVTRGWWNGKPAIFGVTKDISQIKLSEEKFSKAFQLNPSLMAISSIDDGRFIDVNDTFLKTLGYERGEVVGRTSAELALFLSGEKRAALVADVKAGKPVRNVEVQARARNGTLMEGLFSADAIYIGKDSCLLTVMADVTALKEAEKAIRETAEMKSRFASMVSHELRSPLTALTLGLSLVLEEPGQMDAQNKNLLELSKESADRLGRLINNVLDYQKMAAGKMQFDFADADIGELARQACKAMSLLAGNKGLELRVEAAAELPRAELDKDKITQVVTNLLSNAIAHTEKGSVTLRAAAAEGGVRVTVADTGRGMKPADVPRLFQAFEQFDSGGGRKKGGTGLGLAISKEIVAAHHGRIWAESELGKGSSFHFELPLKQPGEQHA